MLGLSFDTSGIINSIMYGMAGIVALTVMIGVAFIVSHYSKYRIIFNVWEVIDDQKKFKRTSAAIRKCKDTQTNYYHLLSNKERIYGQAPPQARNVDGKGRELIEVYRIGPEEYIWRTDKISSELKDGKISKLVHEFKPLNATQRGTIVNQMVIAESRRKKRALDFIMPIAGVMAIIVLIAVVMLFVKKPLEMVTGLEDKTLQIQNKLMQQDEERHDRMMELIDKWDSVLNEYQVIERGRLGEANG